jgi:aspartate/methionine/tyrosine aminotransferase
MHRELAQFIESKIRIPQTAFTYGEGPTGSKRLRIAMSRFLTNRLHPVAPIKPEHLMITNGVTTGIEHCSWALADPGDGFLLGQPYYRAFLSDIIIRPGVKVIPVAFGEIDPCGINCVSKYEEAILSSANAGIKVKALMLCHPHNPLGRCYSRETIIALMKLCQKYTIHLVSDEIYAFSVWKNTVDTYPEPVKFESALSIDLNGIIDPGLVHVLWGMSKDFGSNGLRVGAMISQSNKAFLDACLTVSLYSSGSSISDLITADILDDDNFTDYYIRTNQARLADAYSFTARSLQEHGIEYAPGANAAFFLWINLGKAYLSRHPEEVAEVGKLQVNGETKISELEKPSLTETIFSKLMAKKIFLASGDATGAEEPGWFRLVFSQPRDYLEEGMRRIIDAIA